MTSWLDQDARWVGIREERIAVRGNPVRVLRADSATGQEVPGVPGAEPQLLVHGLGGSSVNWIDVIVPLSRFGPVVAVDLPGFGGTPVADGHDLLEADDDFVLAVADALGWQRFALHGSSMGGLIAALTAARAPERVTKLVLASPALPPRRPTDALPLPWPSAIGDLPLALPVVGSANVEHTLGRMESGHAPIDAQRLLDLMFAERFEVRPAVMQALATDAAVFRLQPAERRAQDIAGVTRSLTRLWLAPKAASDAIDRIVAPTLVVAGQADQLIPSKAFEVLTRSRPDWAVSVVPDAGHVLMLERPDRYVDIVAGWWLAADSHVARSA